MNYFVIGNLHSKDYFKLVEDITISPLEIKKNTVTLQERDGVLDFSRMNMFNRFMYEERIITIPCVFRFNGARDREMKLNKIYNAVYNNSNGILRTSYTDAARWEAKLENIKSFDFIGMASCRVIIQYRVKPFSTGIDNSLFTGNISTSEILRLNSKGSAPTIKHILEISNIDGNTSGVIIDNKTTGDVLKINKAISSKTVIDFDAFTIKEGSDYLKNLEWEGTFFEIQPSQENLIEITMDGSADFNWIETPMYYYGILEG